METFWRKMEKVGEKIVEKILWKISQPPRKCSNDEKKEMVEMQEEVGSSVCCIYKHHNQNVLNEIEWANSLKYEVIRMLIRRNNGYSHALCFHVCDGSSDFHVYSKRGWVSFTPSDKHVLVVTVGDQLEVHPADIASYYLSVEDNSKYYIFKKVSILLLLFSIITF